MGSPLHVYNRYVPPPGLGPLLPLNSSQVGQLFRVVQTDLVFFRKYRIAPLSWGKGLPAMGVGFTPSGFGGRGVRFWVGVCYHPLLYDPGHLRYAVAGCANAEGTSESRQIRISLFWSRSSMFYPLHAFRHKQVASYSVEVGRGEMAREDAHSRLRELVSGGRGAISGPPPVEFSVR